MKAEMSVPALIDSIDGRLSTSNSGIGAALGAAGLPCWVSGAGAATASPVSFFSLSSPAPCLRRDQRLRKLSGSFICDPPVSTDRAAPGRQDLHGRACASRMHARHGAPSRKPQWLLATVPAL